MEAATLAAVRKVLPPKQIDLRQILKNRKQRNADEKTSSDGLVSQTVLYMHEITPIEINGTHYIIQ